MKIASNKSTDEFLAATSPPAGAGGRAAATGFEPPARVAAGRYRVTDSPARSRSYVFYPQILWRTRNILVVFFDVELVVFKKCSVLGIPQNKITGGWKKFIGEVACLPK